MVTTILNERSNLKASSPIGDQFKNSMKLNLNAYGTPQLESCLHDCSCLSAIAKIVAEGYLRLQTKISAERNETVDKPDLQLADPLFPLANPHHQSDESNPLVNDISAPLQGG